MAKKHKCDCPPPGAPAWMVTYGDMVTLLLCFFVLLITFMDVKQEAEWNAVIEEIRKAFGMKGGGAKLPTEEDPETSLVERLETIALQQQREPNRSNTDDPGIEGRDPAVTTVREGMKFIVGGRVTFETGSAELSNTAKRQLDQIAELVRGENNILEVKGHAAAMELSDDKTAGSDLWALSNARAKAVFDHLTSPEVGLNPDRFRLIANADREPLVHRAYSVGEQLPNRRAEVLVSESLISDFNRPQVSTNP